MGFKDRTYLCLLSLILFSVFVISTGQNYINPQTENVDSEYKPIKIVWCTVSKAEHIKCGNFSNANERDRFRVGYDYFKIECYRASDKDECIHLLDEGKATLTTLDAGHVFLGGRYNSLVPIAQEVYPGNLQHYYAVAAVKKDSLPDVHSLYDLKGRRACFAGVETFAGWVIPIYTLMTQGGLDVVDCNNHVKSATKYFGPSCAVNSLTDKFNPIGDNSDQLCQLCIGRIPGGRCTSADPFAGYEGAFRCLQEVGEIAFLKHTTIAELVEGHEFISISKDSYELLCKDGSRRPVDAYESCNWGRVPTDAVVTSSATSPEQRRQYQLFLQKAARHYTGKINYTSQYPLYYNDGAPENRPYDYSADDQNRLNQGYTVNDQNRYNQGNQQGDYYQYGGRPSRYKRQNFGSFDDRSRPQYDQNSNRQNDYDRNGDRGDGKRPFTPDLEPVFSGEYGHNIDPYQDNRNNNRGQQYPPDDVYDNRNYGNESLYEVFKLFQSRYGLNLLFQDATIDIAPLDENLQTYSSFLGSAMHIIMGVRDCPVHKMTLCVTSDMEQDKCIKMKTALNAQLLKPEMDCYKAHSQINCMQAIRSGVADVTVLDASDVYTAGLNFDLIPFINEVYNLNEPESYVVAVAKESDPSTELTYLRGKYTCHGGINTAAGWVYPLAFLISNGWIRSYGCNSIRAAAEYFSKSCVPGALSAEYNTGVPYDNMCDLCHGASFRYCRRDASEDYYGHTGAFRCLVEGGGQVAFVTHTTVTQNTGGKREEWWARDNLNDDFELLCPDGTRAEINEYEKCNLGKVKANAIVTRGGYGYNETHLNAFINLFLYAQTFYGRRTTDEFSFSMFSSKPPYTDLIFQDATTQLKVIHPTKRHYAEYLGSDFLRARRIVDCHAGSASISASVAAVIIAFVLITRT